MGVTGETGDKEETGLELLRAWRKEEVDDELTREARRGSGEHLLDNTSPVEDREREESTHTQTHIHIDCERSQTHASRTAGPHTHAHTHAYIHTNTV